MSAPFRLATAAAGEGFEVVVGHAGGVTPLRALLGAGAAGSMLELFDDWAAAVAAIGDALASGAPPVAAPPPALDVPLRFPRKLICIGSNYRAHVEEMRSKPAQWPYSFVVPPTTTLVPSGATVALPRGAEQVDWEGEVAIVIGRRARDVTGAEADAAIGAYGIVNDLSVRDWTGPRRPAVGNDWVVGKAHDGFKPMAPWLTPAAFVEEPAALRIRTWVGGELKQDGSTRDMVFGFRQIVEHLSSVMTLEPGDVIATGTPAGVGKGSGQFLQPGDLVVVEVD